MFQKVKQKIMIVAERFSQAWTSCMVMMVEGDLGALTLYHAKVASKTGIVTGLAMVAASFIPWKKVREDKWVLTFLLGVATAAADLWNHPTHFGPEWAEAVATGAGAMVLAVLYERVVQKKA